MARPLLNPADQALWSKVASTVRPLPGKPATTGKALAHGPPRSPPLPIVALRPIRPNPDPVPSLPRRAPGDTLDANWDRKLARGSATPERTIDLHGHTLASAHAVLDQALGDAIRRGARLILLITGRPARDNPRMPPTGRGVIRASVQDWIAASPYSGHVASVRGAHPRHGGTGAMYVILRRSRHF